MFISIFLLKLNNFSKNQNGSTEKRIVRAKSFACQESDSVYLSNVGDHSHLQNHDDILPTDYNNVINTESFKFA